MLLSCFNALENVLFPSSKKIEQIMFGVKLIRFKHLLLAKFYSETYERHLLRRFRTSKGKTWLLQYVAKISFEKNKNEYHTHQCVQQSVPILITCVSKSYSFHNNFLVPQKLKEIYSFKCLPNEAQWLPTKLISQMIYGYTWKACYVPAVLFQYIRLSLIYCNIQYIYANSLTDCSLSHPICK